MGNNQKEKQLGGKNAWTTRGSLSDEDNKFHKRPFTDEEDKEAVFSMKDNSAPVPDSFRVVFYTRCWGYIKEELMEMINDFLLERLDIKKY